MEIRGLNKKNIERISTLKKENKYFRDYRLNSYDIFTKLDNPSFGPKYNINYDEIIYYKNDVDKISNDWNNISCSIKNEFQNLGVIDSEKKMDGLGVQYESNFEEGDLM